MQGKTSHFWDLTDGLTIHILSSTVTQLTFYEDKSPAPHSVATTHTPTYTFQVHMCFHTLKDLQISV